MFCVINKNSYTLYLFLFAVDIILSFLLQSVDHGGLCAAFPWPPLIVCQIVFAMATAVMLGLWGQCACWWEGQRPLLLWVTSTPALLPLHLPAEPRSWPMALEAYPSSPQEAPFTPAAKTSTPRTSTALTLKETPTLMHLTVEDLLFNHGQKKR